MYEYVRGRIADRSGTSVVVDAGGVGYELLAAPGARFAAKGEESLVWAHLNVREDAQVLYGFPRREERDLFRVLLRVRGVGPSMALGVLSGLSAAELVAAVRDEDLKALTQVKGIGKKTAEQILLDLRDKALLLMELAGGEASAPSAPARDASQAASPNRGDAVLALASVGYTEKEAQARVDAAAEKVGDGDLEELVRAAMRG